jgi:hypothetical protein
LTIRPVGNPAWLYLNKNKRTCNRRTEFEPQQLSRLLTWDDFQPILGDEFIGALKINQKIKVKCKNYSNAVQH